MESTFAFFREYQRFHIQVLSDRITNKNIADNFISELLVKGILVLDSNGIYFFKFVGAISFLEIMVIVFPKYKSIPQNKFSNENKSYAKQLFDIFRKFESKSVSNTDSIIKDYNDDRDYFSLFALYRELINDYLEYGLYENHKNIHELSGAGEIDWLKTVSEVHPFFSSDSKPIYTSYYTKDIEKEHENYIKSIHMELLSLATKCFKNFKDFGLNSLDLEYYFDDEISDEFSYKILKINLELREVFLERKIRLLNIMKEILDILQHSAIKSLNLYGTRNFEKVWENICQNVLGHEKIWIEKITKPVWLDYRTKNQIEVSTLLPDITVMKNEIFYILDAKYYDCEFDDKGRLKGTKPGVGDISKQFLYQGAYESYFSKNLHLNYFNAFLMPTEEIETSFEVIGEITFPLNIFKSKIIKIIKLNTQKIYDLYLKENKNFEYLNLFLKT